jgi:Carboxylesterase type B
MGYLELGSSASQARQGQGVPLLLRSASELPGGFPERRPRLRARFEIPYVFQHLPASATEPDKAISEVMAVYWTNFAKKGDPNGPGVPAWPAYDDRDPRSMYFSQTAYVGPVPSWRR